jgi:hypothetical protein
VEHLEQFQTDLREYLSITNQTGSALRFAIHNIRLDLPQFDGPENPRLAQLFSEWLAEFTALREREPDLAEIVEWAYQEGVKDGKANGPDAH